MPPPPSSQVPFSQPLSTLPLHASEPTNPNATPNGQPSQIHRLPIADKQATTSLEQAHLQPDHMPITSETALLTTSTTRETPVSVTSYPPTENTRGRVLTYQDLARCFHLPINSAALKLGVCVTALKKQCRRHGVQRWPHRKLKSLDKLKEKLEREEATAADKEYYKHEIHSIAQKKDHIFRAVPVQCNVDANDLNCSVPPNISSVNNNHPSNINVAESPDGLANSMACANFNPPFPFTHEHPPLQSQHQAFMMPSPVLGPHQSIPAPTQAPHPHHIPTPFLAGPMGTIPIPPSKFSLCGMLGCDCVFNNGISTQNYHVPIPFHPTVPPGPTLASRGQFVGSPATTLGLAPNATTHPYYGVPPNYAYQTALQYPGAANVPAAFHNMVQLNVVDNQSFGHRPTSGPAQGVGRVSQPSITQVVPGGSFHTYPIVMNSSTSGGQHGIAEAIHGPTQMSLGFESFSAPGAGPVAVSAAGGSPEVAIPTGNTGNTTSVRSNVPPVPSDANRLDKAVTPNGTPHIQTHYWPAAIGSRSGGGNTFTMYNQTTHFHHHHRSGDRAPSTVDTPHRTHRSNQTGGASTVSSATYDGGSRKKEKLFARGTIGSVSREDENNPVAEAAGSSDEILLKETVCTGRQVAREKQFGRSVVEKEGEGSETAKEAAGSSDEVLKVTKETDDQGSRKQMRIENHTTGNLLVSDRDKSERPQTHEVMESSDGESEYASRHNKDPERRGIGEHSVMADDGGGTSSNIFEDGGKAKREKSVRHNDEGRALEGLSKRKPGVHKRKRTDEDLHVVRQRREVGKRKIGENGKCSRRSVEVMSGSDGGIEIKGTSDGNRHKPTENGWHTDKRPRSGVLQTSGKRAAVNGFHDSPVRLASASNAKSLNPPAVRSHSSSSDNESSVLLRTSDIATTTRRVGESNEKAQAQGQNGLPQRKPHENDSGGETRHKPEPLDPPSPNGGDKTKLKHEDAAWQKHDKRNCDTNCTGPVITARTGSGGKEESHNNRPHQSGAGSDGSISACMRSRARRYEQVMMNCLSAGCAQWCTDKLLRVTLAVGTRALLGVVGIGSVGSNAVDSASESTPPDNSKEMRKRYNNVLRGQRMEWTMSSGRRRVLVVLAPFRKRTGVEIVGVSGVVLEVSARFNWQ